MHDSNFGVDEHGRTVVMDFRDVGVLPETFVASMLGKSSSTLKALRIIGDSNGHSMAAIRASVWTASQTTFDMLTCSLHMLYM